jgi:hypothetical protein
VALRYKPLGAVAATVEMTTSALPAITCRPDTASPPAGSASVRKWRGSSGSLAINGSS